MLNSEQARSGCTPEIRRSVPLVLLSDVQSLRSCSVIYLLNKVHKLHEPNSTLNWGRAVIELRAIFAGKS
jgi:hypothetical protein